MGYSILFYSRLPVFLQDGLHGQFSNAKFKVQVGNALTERNTFLKAAQCLHGFILFQTWKEKRALILNTTTASALNFCMKSSQHSNYGFSQSPPTDRECLLTELLFAILLILQEDHKDNNYEDFCMLFSSITSLLLFRESRSIEKYSPYIINSFQ